MIQEPIMEKLLTAKWWAAKTYSPVSVARLMASAILQELDAADSQMTQKKMMDSFCSTRARIRKALGG